MKQYRCGLCDRPHNSIYDAAQCETSCIALEQQYMDYYGCPQESNKVIKKATKVVIEMPGDVIVKITCSS